jgi:hypothetical protein
VLAIAELGAAERNQRVLDVQLATMTLAKENIHPTFNGFFRGGCIRARSAASLEQRVLAVDNRAGDQAGRDVNTSERRECSKKAVGIHVQEFRVDDGDNMVCDKPTPESVSKLCGRRATTNRSK